MSNYERGYRHPKGFTVPISWDMYVKQRLIKYDMTFVKSLFVNVSKLYISYSVLRETNVWMQNVYVSVNSGRFRTMLRSIIEFHDPANRKRILFEAWISQNIVLC